ncbi:MAG TPA: lytic transglycosylase domain-containing protein [Dermatophilaceae bacterium]|nr:lytic transglycosylase domain-containing protein [Dermatophilaceae bacterium]
MATVAGAVLLAAGAGLPLALAADDGAPTVGPPSAAARSAPVPVRDDLGLRDARPQPRLLDDADEAALLRARRTPGPTAPLLATRPLPQPPAAPPPPDPVPRSRADRTAPDWLREAYAVGVRSAPATCRMRVAVLAAIGQVESGSLGARTVGADGVVRPAVYGVALDGNGVAAIPDTDGGRLDGSAQWDRAVGPMQFIPGTWRSVGRDGDDDGSADPQDVVDAAVSATAYLCLGGRDLGTDAGLDAAVLSYNRSGAYLATVRRWITFFDVNGLGGLGHVSVPVANGTMPVPAAAAATASPSSPATTTAPPGTASPQAAATPKGTATPREPPPRGPRGRHLRPTRRPGPAA